MHELAWWRRIAAWIFGAELEFNSISVIYLIRPTEFLLHGWITSVDSGDRSFLGFLYFGSSSIICLGSCVVVVSSTRSHWRAQEKQQARRLVYLVQHVYPASSSWTIRSFFFVRHPSESFFSWFFVLFFQYYFFRSCYRCCCWSTVFQTKWNIRYTLRRNILGWWSSPNYNRGWRPRHGYRRLRLSGLLPLCSWAFRAHACSSSRLVIDCDAS